MAKKQDELRIDFAELGGPVYIGRARGRKAREQLGLEEFDEGDRVVKVLIPDGTYALNSSYFLGLFGPSIRRAGSISEFKSKYPILAPPHLRASLDDYIIRCDCYRLKIPL